MTEPIPAATVVLVRDGPDGLEVLMLRRGEAHTFGGMWAFPGGRVETEDLDPVDPTDDLAAARRAAVRETLEEADLVLTESDLVPFAHWMPPEGAPRRYATWFFLGAAPAEGVTVDGYEIDDHAWFRPDDALAARDSGQIELAPPTWMTLRRLAAYDDVAAALRDAAATVPERFRTRIGRAGDALVALWHGDAGYDDGDADRPGARHRLHMEAGGWRFERSP